MFRSRRSTRAVARLFLGGALSVTMLGAALALAPVSPASASGTTWYAYAVGTSLSTRSCREGGTIQNDCSLAQALANAGAYRFEPPSQSQAEDDTNSIDVTEVSSSVVSSTDATGNLLANDQNLDTDPSTITSVSDPKIPSGVTPDVNGVITIDGAYGTLDVYTQAHAGHSAGDYSYALDNGVVPPCASDTDVFTYTLTDSYSRSSTANLTVSLDVSCAAPPTITISLCPNEEVTCVVGSSSTPGGSATASDDGVTVTASGGEGTFWLGSYGSDPEGSLSNAGEYFDVLLEPGSSFTSLAITSSDLSGGNSLDWWNGSAWVPVVGDPGPTFSAGPPPILTVTLDSTTSPTLAELTATPFAVVKVSALAPPPVPTTPGPAPTTPGPAPTIPAPAPTTPLAPQPSSPVSVPGSQSPCITASYGGDSAFVCEAYEDLLGRLPDPGGLATFLGLIQAGASRTLVAYDIDSSAEYDSDLVEAIYEGFLSRPADPGGLANFVGQVASGVTEQQVEAEVVGSEEFFLDSGATDQGFLELAYEKLFGRPPDPSGLSTFTGLLGSGASRARVAYDMISSTEYQTDTIAFYYRALLGRSPDSGGLATFESLLGSGGTVQQLIADMVGSAEFYVDATGG